MEESIYNIIQPKAAEHPKPKAFKVQPPKNVAPTASTFRVPGSCQPAVVNVGGEAVCKINAQRDHAEFGKPPGSYSNDPSHFMKKMAKNTSVPSLAEMKRTSPDELKPTRVRESRFGGVGGPPKKGDVPIMNLVSSKNFIVANAVETILAAPKKIQDKTKDYLQKEEYGKVPKYLTRIKKDIDAEYDYIRQLQEQQMAESARPIRQMSEEERSHLLEQLKAKWESVNTTYQGLTHLTVLDTIGKVHTKEKCEAELLQLERDIERLNRRGILVDAGA